MKNVILIIALLISTSVKAQDDKTVTLVVSGQGKTQDEAKQNALRSAIEQAFGAFISSKTEILNDSLVKDEVVSITNGNIKSYEILSEATLPNSIYSVTLNATISLNKLGEFIKTKGYDQIEFDGGGFAMNLKIQKLNENAEIIAINNLLSLSFDMLKKSINYKLNVKGPEQINESESYSVPIEVLTTWNSNRIIWEEYFLSTLKSISMSENEIKTYTDLKKTIFKFRNTSFKFNEIKSELNFRTRTTIQMLKIFTTVVNISPVLGFKISNNIDTFCVSSNPSMKFSCLIKDLHPESNLSFWTLSHSENVNPEDFKSAYGFNSNPLIRSSYLSFEYPYPNPTPFWVRNEILTFNHMNRHYGQYDKFEDYQKFIELIRKSEWPSINAFYNANWTNYIAFYDMHMDGNSILFCPYDKSIDQGGEVYSINIPYTINQIEKLKNFKIESIY